MFPLVACPVSSAGWERWRVLQKCVAEAYENFYENFLFFFFFLVYLFFLKYICRMNVNILFFSSLCGFPAVREFD